MADNYLEKKFEEHFAHKAAPTQQRRNATPASALKPNALNIKLPGKRVFVTGGACGIGKAIVEAYRAADCKVAFCDIDRTQGNITAQSSGARFYPLDIKDTSALIKCMDDIAERWGDMDIIINNVGIGNFKPLIESSITDFNDVISTNLLPVFITGRYLACHRDTQQERNPYGRIINISSTRYKQSEAGTEAYSASKGGVMSLTHALMMSLANYRVTVNCIAPGWIHNGDRASLSAEEHEQHPSMRVGKPEDIAAMCLFLSLPDNDFINGQVISIDGGMTTKMIYPY